MSATTVSFTVPGMTCGHCKQAVTGELTKISGVNAVDVDLDTKKVVVSGTDAIAWADIEAAVDEAGFEAVAG